MCAHLPPEMGCLTHVHDYANDERATAWQRKNSTTHKRTTSPQPLVQPAPRRPTDSPQMWGNARMPAKRVSRIGPCRIEMARPCATENQSELSDSSWRRLARKEGVRRGP
ncbi:unnamed protein product [Prorocentrum cordatum]|uniref:Uncharacterized protein n=1 Tax=Prorocentrum cordatum TaxID=2364126 RepID=A0ABN9XN76_9DINO|nr:unnamed protein product [Polarella glacialis]